MKGTFSFSAGGFGKNLIVFGADVSSFVHVDNKKKYILILGEGRTRELDDKTLTVEKSIQSILLNVIKSFV